MRRINASYMAVALSGVALFVALGGPAWAAKAFKATIGTKQLKNNAVTSRKIKPRAVHSSDLARGAVRNRNLRHGSVSASKLRAAAVTTGALADAAVTNGKLADGSVSTGKLADAAVTNGKLADNAVTSGKVADGSLTAGDVAPNTFLAAGGTAQNSLAVGGFTAAQLAQQASANHVVVPANGAQQLLVVIPTGFLRASCPGNKPAVTYANASSPVDYAVESVDGNGSVTPATVHFTTLQGITGTGSDTVTGATGLQRLTFQIAAKTDRRETTAWTSGHVEGTNCVFTAQAISTG